jgi:hypothetical protein
MERHLIASVNCNDPECKKSNVVKYYGIKKSQNEEALRKAAPERFVQDCAVCGGKSLHHRDSLKFSTIGCAPPERWQPSW